MLISRIWRLWFEHWSFSIRWVSYALDLNFSRNSLLSFCLMNAILVPIKADSKTLTPKSQQEPRELAYVLNSIFSNPKCIRWCFLMKLWFFPCLCQNVLIFPWYPRIEDSNLKRSNYACKNLQSQSILLAVNVNTTVCV